MSILFQCPSCSACNKLTWIYIPTLKSNYEPVNTNHLLQIHDMNEEPSKQQFRWDATACSFFVVAVYSVAKEGGPVTPLAVLNQMWAFGFDNQLLTRGMVSSKLQNLHNGFGTKQKKRKHQEEDTTSQPQKALEKQEMLIASLEKLKLEEVLSKICTDKSQPNQLEEYERNLIPDLVSCLRLKRKQVASKYNFEVETVGSVTSSKTDPKPQNTRSSNPVSDQMEHNFQHILHIASKDNTIHNIGRRRKTVLQVNPTRSELLSTSTSGILNSSVPPPLWDSLDMNEEDAEDPFNEVPEDLQNTFPRSP